MSKCFSISGWTTVPELKWLMKRASGYKSIVEIGAWMGRSTVALLTTCPGLVYVVDNWNPEDMEDYGDPVVARQKFFKNISDYRNIIIFQMPSNRACHAFRDKSVEMVFIDANHTYEGAKEDIDLWLPKTTKLICGHDYNEGWPGVVRAVNEKFNNVNTLESIWYVEL